MEALPPWLLGALAGGGVLAVWYGLKFVRDPEAAATHKRNGLLLVNLGVILVCGSLALMIFLR